MEPIKQVARWTPWYDADRVRAYRVQESAAWQKHMTGARVLEVGCGPGTFGSHRAMVHHALRYCGLDFSVGMIADATRLNPGHTFLAGDIGALPFLDGAFDLVFCCHVIHHLPVERRAAALRELARVSRHVVIVADVYGFERGLRKHLYELYYRLADGSYYRFHLREWRTWFTANGFRIVEHADCGNDTITHRLAYWVVDVARMIPSRAAQSFGWSGIEGSSHDG